ncbi:MAG: NADH:ubiquinone oxidoreductase subunit NDUFA12 [Acidisphaera sp.]|nr:NADH:ubiquinone oxidoreductase subunit NDUFA12 [Acidisphaera sp.]MBV9813331.1 NADH:ubiquinone oxidoreductase subunit NDUFA12 [Acetobacteraceae bacterium]
MAAMTTKTTIGTRLFTWLRGRRVGEDALGNVYYEEKRPSRGQVRRRRWVLYRGMVDASTVPAEWHAWIHYTSDAPLPQPQRPWIKPHVPNLTGTPESYRPPGHDYEGGRRPPATGDYEAWTPGE